MFSFEVNYLAVIVATAIAFIAGAIYYSPPLLGKAWMKLVSLSEMKASPKHWVAGIINNLVLGYVLALMILNLGAETIGQAIMVAVLAWIGFMLTVMYSDVLWGKKPFKLMLINAGNFLISSVIIAVVLTLWK